MTEFTLPTAEQIELMATRDLIMNFNHFAPTAGQNPVKKFQDRQVGIKRLTAVADALRAAGKTEAAPATEFPLIVRPVITVENRDAGGFPITGQFHDDTAQATIGWDNVDTTSDDPKAFDPATATEAELLANGFVELTPIPEPVAPKAKKGKASLAPKVAAAPKVNGHKVELTGDAEAKAKKAAPVKVASTKKNLSARLREEIEKGLDNAAIWAIIQPEFDLADNKKGYVAGQRRAMAK